jgi:hypothetical protein
VDLGIATQRPGRGAAGQDYGGTSGNDLHLDDGSYPGLV